MDLIYTSLVLVLCGPGVVFGTTTTSGPTSTTPLSTSNVTFSATVGTTLASNTTSSMEDDPVTLTPTNGTTSLSSNVSVNTTMIPTTLQPTTSHLPTTTSHLPPTTSHLPPTTSHLPPTTSVTLTTPTTTITTTTEAPFNCSVTGSMCKNRGTCTSSGDCDCTARYTGERCELLNLCNATSCQNNGTCELAPGWAYKCSCITGDPQLSCALNTRKECTEIPPMVDNLITCVDYIGGHNMICRPGFTGTGCQSQATDDFCQRRAVNYCSDIHYCKPLCNFDQCNGTRACTFTIEPYSHPAYVNRTQCIKGFADSYHDPECTTEDLLFDAFDHTRSRLDDCSPYFNTLCTTSFNDGICNEHCNHGDCLWDGWDCVNTSFPGSVPLPVPVGGRVVVELESVNVFKVKKVLELLLRSKVEIETSSQPVRHVHVKVSSTNFTQVLTVGRFLAAAFAKLPSLLPVTDVFVCENGTYSHIYGDKCKRMCSPNCVAVAGEDYCQPTSGHCLHGCAPGYWGAKCDIECPALCGHACDRQGRCACQSGSYWSDATKNCVPCSDNCQDTCHALNGTCTCKPVFHGPMCGLTCSAACKHGRCRGVDGACSGGCERGLHGMNCSLNCSDRCPDCEQMDGGCHGRCLAGYEGRNCEKIVMAPVTNNDGVIIAVILAILIVVIIIVTTYCCWKRRQSGDYVLEDEEKEPPVMMTSTAGNQQAPLLQPGAPALGRSADMIDMDERTSPAGIYQGPNRATVVATNITDITADDHLPTTEVSANGDVSVTVDIKVTDAEQHEPLLAIEAGNAVDVSNDAAADGGAVTMPGDDDDKDDDAVSGDSDLPPSVPLATSGAPLASEEDILLSKENLLEGTGDHGESDTEDGDPGDQPEQEKRKSSRKSSTSSQSSSSSSSSDSSHKSSKSNLETDMTSGEPTTEI